LLQKIEKNIDDHLTPYRKQVELLDTIPGVDKSSAVVLVPPGGVNVSFEYKDLHREMEMKLFGWQ
jgi:hypothetical protein